VTGKPDRLGGGTRSVASAKTAEVFARPFFTVGIVGKRCYVHPVNDTETVTVMPTQNPAKSPPNGAIPSRPQCLALIGEMEMMAHILDHSLAVCHVALVLTDHLLAAGIALDRGLVEAGALLHDITKTRSLATGEDHALSGGQWLSRRGYHAVAELVRQHVRLDCFDPAGRITEAEVVNYADKRVLHDKIVGLEDRMAYIWERYGTTLDKQERIRRLASLVEMMEAKIFAPLTLAPEALTGLTFETGNRKLETGN